MKPRNLTIEPLIVCGPPESAGCTDWVVLDRGILDAIIGGRGGDPSSNRCRAWRLANPGKDHKSRLAKAAKRGELA